MFTKFVTTSLVKDNFLDQILNNYSATSGSILLLAIKGLRSCSAFQKYLGERELNFLRASPKKATFQMLDILLAATNFPMKPLVSP